MYLQNEACFFVIVAIRDSKKARSKQDLQLLHKEIFRVVDADQGANDVAGLVCSEICTMIRVVNLR